MTYRTVRVISLAFVAALTESACSSQGSRGTQPDDDPPERFAGDDAPDGGRPLSPDGAPAAPPVRWDRTFSTPAALQTRPAHAWANHGRLALAGNSAGDALALWVEVVSDPEVDWPLALDIVSSRFTGGAWETAELADPVDESADLIGLGMDESGTAAMAWYFQDERSAYRLVSRHVPGAGWLEPDQMATGQPAFGGCSGCGSQGLGVSSAGHIVFPGRCEVRRYRPSTSDWSEEELWRACEESFGLPLVAVASDGNVWMAASVGFRLGVGLDDSIQTWRWDGAWSAGPALSESAGVGEVGPPSLAATPDGRTAFVVWVRYDGARNSLWASRFQSGAWGPAERIEEDDVGNAGITSLNRPTIAVNPAGDALVSWYQWYPGEQSRVWANVFDSASETWGDAAAIDEVPGYAEEPTAVAIDPSGNGLVLWPGDDAVRARRYLAGQGWTDDPPLMVLPSDSTRMPRVVLGADGAGVAVWLQHDGTMMRVFSSVFR